MQYGMLGGLLKRIGEFADEVVKRQNRDNPEGPQFENGRVKAFVNFVGMVLGPKKARKAVPRPLGKELGFEPIQINSEAVLKQTANKFRDAEGKPAKHVTYEQIAPTLWTHVKNAVRQTLGKERADTLQPEDVSGKGHLGWVTAERSARFNLGKDQWRIGDFLRSVVVAFERAIGVNEVTFVKKEALSDGVAGVVKPELLGLAPGTWGIFQIRAVVTTNQEGKRDAPIDNVWRVFKGLVIVSPRARNVWAWDDGYGLDKRDAGPAFIHVFNMVDVQEFDPKARYTLQGLYYQGIKKWFRAVFAIENVRLSMNEESRMWHHRLIAADAPVRALGGHGVSMALSALLSLSVMAGKSRVAIGAKAFNYIAGWEHVAAIENDKPYFDNETAFNREEHPKALPKFYAPMRLQSYYLKAGGLLSQWVLNRRPDLPTGQCVIRHELVGFVPLNAFVVPSWSMTLSGCDFDGDLLVVFPPQERGGLYQAFNDLPIAEQKRRLRGATTDRKAVKRNFKNSFERWAGQLEAAPVLGRADIAARRLIDAGQPEVAWTLQPWIQTAVDRQKRPIPWPNDAGPAAMPAASKVEGFQYATDMLRDLTKIDSKELTSDLFADFEAAQQAGAYMAADAVRPSEYQVAWRVFETKVSMLRSYADRLTPEFAQTVYAPDPEMVALMARWGYEMHERLKQAVAELPYGLKRDVYGRVMQDDDGRDIRNDYPLAHVVDFPDRVVGEVEPFEDPTFEKVAKSVEQLDAYFVHALRDRTHGANKGVDNLKDGLVDACDYLGIREQVAARCKSYRVFRYFATPKQLKEYFAQVEGLRVSDLFTVVEGGDFEKVLPAVVVNKAGVFVGFTRLAPGECKLTSRVGGGITVETPHGTFETNATTIQDALIMLRMHMNQHIPDIKPVVAAGAAKPANPTDDEPPAPPSEDAAALLASLDVSLDGDAPASAGAAPAILAVEPVVADPVPEPAAQMLAEFDFRL